MSEGVFAYKAEVDVWWGKDGAITKPGRGVVTQYFMTEQQYPDGDLKFQGTLKGCGASLPPFHAAPICESYQATFEVWEDVPPIAIKGSWDCLDPGCTGSLEPQVLSIGMSLDDPRGDWPQPKDLGSLSCPEGSTVDCFPDHDGDGMPGMTATMLTSGVSIAGDPDFLICLGGDRQFTGAPPGPVESLIPGQPRVEEIFLGLRVGMGGEMTLNDSCSGGSGGGTVQYIDARSVDCTLDDGNACPVSASSFTDEQLPVYHPLNVGDVPPDAIGLIAIDDTSVSAGPAFEAVRLGDLGAGFSCADAVAALK